jgi:hypothetical protein
MSIGGRAISSVFRGLRTGDARLLLLGVALVAFDRLRRRRTAEVVYQRRLKPGQAMTIRVDPQDR